MIERGPYLNMVLDYIDRVLNPEFFCHSPFLVSKIQRSGMFSVKNLLHLPEFIRIKCEYCDIHMALISSLKFRDYFDRERGELTLPFVIDTKILLLFDLPKGIGQRVVNNYVSALSGYPSFTAQRHKEGIKCTFPTAEEMIALWRSLSLIHICDCRVKGKAFIEKAHIKPPCPTPMMTRSQSMVLKKPRPIRSGPRQSKYQNNTLLKDEDFPALQ